MLDHSINFDLAMKLVIWLKMEDIPAFDIKSDISIKANYMDKE